MGIPKKPTIDHLIAEQEKVRTESTGVPKPKAARIGKKTDNNLSLAPVAPIPQAAGMVAQGETLKQTQFNLPVSLNGRIGAVANVFHAGNRSHFVRAVLEKAVAEYEELMAKQELGTYP